MINLQSEVADSVVSFGARAALLRAERDASDPLGACLTARDRIDIMIWQDAARDAGYDRMVIHDRDIGDASDVGTFLSVYSRGKAWSRWGFARRGERILAWCCLSGADIGEFSSLALALQTVLLGQAGAAPAILPVTRPDYASAVVTQLYPDAKARGRRIGSAA